MAAAALRGTVYKKGDGTEEKVIEAVMKETVGKRIKKLCRPQAP